MPTIGSLYFHIPFCTKKCPYCHFFVVPDHPRFKEPLLDALLQEWELRLPLLKEHMITSIYFGGGTPTKWEPAAYKTLLSRIRDTVSLTPDCEITLEANPEDVSLELMQEFYKLGINRVSLGVQSLVEKELATLERTHSSARAKEAIHQTYAAGITNISIDLLFDLPHQTKASFQQTLEALTHLPITHLSLYNLVLEPHTVFFKHKSQITPLLPDPDESLALFEQAIAAFKQIGLERYEISAFCKEGYQSRHNVGYWTGRPFLGFGPSAFSYWEGSRFANVSSLSSYFHSLKNKQIPTSFSETLPTLHHLHELFAVELRLVSGIDLLNWKRTKGPIPESLKTVCDLLENKGWIECNQDSIRLTPLGQLFYDSVAVEILPA
ncbi:MAG: oxygen-independent coproporphyrinogen-III oxidase 1 [Chlamydiota bacterium]|jgi:oxygen-independent coproporphyrinogen-3 oxidase